MAEAMDDEPKKAMADVIEPVAASEVVDSVPVAEVTESALLPTTEENKTKKAFIVPTLTRLLPYWFTVLACTWSIAILIAWNSDKAWEEMQAQIVDPLFENIDHAVAKDWSFILVSFTVPIMFAACLSYLILTNSPLPANKLGWMNKLVAFLVPFRLGWMNNLVELIGHCRLSSADEGYHIAKKNQFLKGEPNFNMIAMCVIGIPVLFQLTYFKPLMVYWDTEAEEHGWDEWRVQRQKILGVSYFCGWIGTLALMWFLIPVARHSVLLVALGWSPVHALRIHIWAGHLSFLFVAIHAVTMLIVWFQDPIPVYQQFIPPASCWGAHVQNFTLGDGHEDHEIHFDCRWQWFNLTGLIAMIIFIGLWVSSLHWFRRRNYRVFYLLHVILGTSMLLSSLLHYAFMIMYWLPSITYYLASTSPTLVQALASRYRGGVKIQKVVQIKDAAGCFEVHVDTTRESAFSLNKVPSQFVKLCVPKISVVWHPFTVFAHPKDPSTLRFLCRPVGPFTKQLAERLTGPERPVTILDGFYTGANRCNEAFLHDHVTIVAGGVAITPFLSMIPALIKEIAANGVSSVYTKSISLHWACRENGLLSYISQNYLALFQDQAKAAGIPLNITIYHTGTEKRIEDSENSVDATFAPDSEKQDQTLNDCGSGDESNTDSIPNPNDTNTMSYGDNSEGGIEKGDEPVVEDTKDIVDFFNQDKSTEGEGSSSSMGAESPGFAMELGRMMPARVSKFYWNFPMFFVYSLSIWLGYVVVHETYFMGEATSFKDLSTSFFYAIVLVLMYGGFGVIIEGAVLHLRSRFPTERLDDFEVEQVCQDGKSMNEDTLVSVTVISGRPTGAQVLECARKAEAPGIFMCGPEKMVQMIKQETNKENTWIGRTRFCVYDEPFEF